jgi:hypothetical protein
MEFTLDFFDALRRMKVRRSGSVPVAQVEPLPQAVLANEGLPLRIGPAGLALIKQFEGCARKRSDGCIEAYPDPGTGGEPWTIGWGAAGPGIALGTVWTQQ